MRTFKADMKIFKQKTFSYSVLLLSLILCKAYCTNSCSQNDRATLFLDAAVDMISKAKHNMSSCNDGNSTQKPVDCTDVLQMGYNSSGVYTIWPLNRVTENKALNVYCDMDTERGGWTLIQRRGDFLREKDYFFKDWKAYKEGFGNVRQDFWLGNDNIFALSNQKLYTLRIDMEDVELNKKFAQYDTFWTGDEDIQYTLHISDFSGTAGDSMTLMHNNQKFSTKDQEHDVSTTEDCAKLYKGGWWYGWCHLSNLNGLYLKGKHESFADGINWHSWRGHHESLKSTEMKIRPKDFLPRNQSVVTPLR